MGPGENSGSHMMPSGSPGMGPGMGSQFMGQQSYGDAVSKGYGQPIMYGRPSAAYNPASAYGGRYAYLWPTKWLNSEEGRILTITVTANENSASCFERFDVEM